jgi:hypothetical protein
MRKFIVFDGGAKFEISSINYQEFIVLDLLVGSSDTTNRHWLRHNGFEDPSDHRTDALREATFQISLKPFNLNDLEFSEDGETWKPIDLNKKFSIVLHT